MIKRIEEQDLPRLKILYEQLVSKPSNPDMLLRRFREVRDDEHYLLLGIYDAEGVLRGSVSLSKCLDLSGDCLYYYNLENLVIDEECRRCGYGKELLKYCEEYVGTHDGHYLNLTSSMKRKDAHLFYERLGYGDYPVRGFKKIIKE